jgi:hypothetical protein
MHPVDIRSGLRKLEFQHSRARSADDDSERVLVEFVHATRLDPHQTVSVTLGVRDGVLRQLVGRPTLLQEQSDKGNAVYYYRLQGTVARTEPDA